MTRWQALVDIALALALAVLAGGVAGWIGLHLLGWTTPPMMLLLGVQGLVVLIGLAALLAWRGQSWRTLGLPMPRAQDLWRAMLALLLVFAVNIALNLVMQLVQPGLMEAHQARLQDLAGVLGGDLKFAAIVGVMMLIGFYEEVLARGLLLQRCRRITGGIWAPVLISSVLFGLGHFYQGWAGVVQTAAIGVVFARLTLHWGTLWPVIIAHAALNSWSMALARWIEQYGG